MEFVQVFEEFRRVYCNVKSKNINVTKCKEFAKEKLGRLLDGFLSKVYTYHTDNYRTVNYFLISTLDYQLINLEIAYETYLKNLNTLFDSSRPFYKSYLMNKTEMELSEEFSKIVQNLKINVEGADDYIDIDVSLDNIFFALLVNLFGALKGFEKVSCIIEKVAKKDFNLEIIKQVLELINQLLIYLSTSKWKTLVIPICNVIFESFNKIDGKVLEYIDGPLLYKVFELLKKVYGGGPKLMKKDICLPILIKMALCIKLMKSPLTERRSTGLALISDEIEKQNNKSSDESSLFVDALNKYKFFENFLTIPEFTVNVVYQAKNIIEFLYIQRSIKENDIVKLLNTFKTSGSEQKNAFYYVIKSLIEKVPYTNTEFLINHLQCLPLYEHTPEAVKIAWAIENSYVKNHRETNVNHKQIYESKKDFDSGNVTPQKGDALSQFIKSTESESPADTSEQSIKLQGKSKERLKFVEFIFSLVSDQALENGLKPDIQDMYIYLFAEQLIDSFNAKDYEPLSIPQKYLSKNVSILQLMKIFSHTIERLKYNINARKYICNETLLKQFLLSLLKFKAKAGEVARKLSEETDGLEKLKLNEFHDITYYTELKTRLNFINYLAYYGSIQLSDSDINILCNAFITVSYSPKELACFFEFMAAFFKQKNSLPIIITNSFNIYLYEVLLRIDFKNYTAPAFESFMYLFIALNIQYGLIECLSTDACIIKTTELLCMDVLWKIVFNTTDDEAYKNSSELLIDIYKEIIKYDWKKKVVVIDFIDACMKNLKISPSVIINDSTTADLVRRSLELLEKIIEFSEIEDDASSSIMHSGSKHPVRILWDGTLVGVDSVSENMKVTEFLEQVKKLAKRNEPIEKLIFELNGKSLAPVDDIIGNYGIMESATINVRLIEEVPEKMVDTIEPEGAQSLFPLFEQEIQDLMSFEPTKHQLPEYPEQELSSSRMAHDENFYEVNISPISLSNEILSVKTEEPLPKSITIASIIANNTSYIETMHLLLKCSVPEILQKTLTILNKIPIQGKELENYKLKLSFDPKKLWNHLIPIQEPYEILYNLRGLMTLIRSDNTWNMDFLKMNGFKFLCDILKLKLNVHGNQMLIQGLEGVAKIIAILTASAFKSLSTDNYSMFADKFETSKVIELLKLNDNLRKILYEAIDDHKPHKAALTALNFLNKIQEDKFVISYKKILIYIIFVSLCYDSRYLIKLYEDDDLKEFILNTLLKPGNSVCKEELKKTLLAWFDFIQLVKNHATISIPDVYVLNILLKALFNNDFFPIKSEAYFSLFVELISTYYRKSENKIECSIEELIDRLIKILNKITSMEEKSKKTMSDYDIQFMGSLSILLEIMEKGAKYTKIISSNPSFNLKKTLLKILYKNTSKKLPSNRQFTSDTEISHAVKILQKLYAADNDINILNTVNEFYRPLKKVEKKRFVETNIHTAGPTDYVGLYNFRNNCYINTLLQQLYMIKEFREYILGLDDRIFNSNTSGNVLRQLRVIFQKLSKQNPDTFSTEFFSFCTKFSFSDRDTRGHQDATEFLSYLKECIERETNTTESGSIFKRELEFRFVRPNMSVENSFPTSSVNYDNLTLLTLPVGKSKTLEEAMDIYTETEILYINNNNIKNASDKLITITQKAYLESLTKTVGISLNRWKMSSNMDTAIKLNDYLEFPHIINFGKWMQEPKEMLYDLVGVVVHFGSVNAGHYYSLVKERDKNSLNYGKWFKMNDMSIKEYSIERLNIETFGGPGPTYTDNNSSAYILFYQRRDADIPSKVVPELNVLQNKEEIERILCNANHYNFIREIINEWAQGKSMFSLKKKKEDKQAKLKKSETLCKLAITAMHNIWEENKSQSELINWIGKIIKYMNKNSKICNWILEYLIQNKDSTFEIILQNRKEDFRENYKKLIKDIIEITLPKTETSSSASNLMNIFINDFPKNKINKHQCSCYFELIDIFCNIKKDFIGILIEKKWIKKIVEFVSSTIFTLSLTVESAKSATVEHEIQLKIPIKLLKSLICSCYTKEMMQKNTTYLNKPLQEMLPLPSDEIDEIFSIKWIQSNLLEKYYDDIMNYSLHLCWESKDLSCKMLNSLLVALFSKKKMHNYEKELMLIGEILKLKDSLEIFRCKQFLETNVYGGQTIYEIIDNEKKDKGRFSLDLLYLIAELLDNTEIHKVIDKEKLRWVLEWAKIKRTITKTAMEAKLNETNKILSKYERIVNTFTEKLKLDVSSKEKKQANIVKESPQGKSEEGHAYHNKDIEMRSLEDVKKD